MGTWSNDMGTSKCLAGGLLLQVVIWLLLAGLGGILMARAVGACWQA
jgi:hypothetical protein